MSVLRRERPRADGGSIVANTFSIYSLGSSHEERLIGYIVREHRAGRALCEVLEDEYVRRRCCGSTLDVLLERPRLIRALVDDVAAARSVAGEERLDGRVVGAG